MIIPGEYTLAETIERRRKEAAIIIQKYFRRYLSQQIVNQLKIDKVRWVRTSRSQLRVLSSDIFSIWAYFLLFRYEKWVVEEKARLEEEREKRRERNIKGRLNPRTERDFELVWSALGTWRQEQIAHIQANAQTPVEQKAALAILQEQVAQLVAAIGRHKTRFVFSWKNFGHIFYFEI